MYELKDKEWIFVFTGPDGSGRKTMADMVGSTFGMKKVISYCTRKPRPGERDGQDYHFISHEEFLKAEERGEFLETIRLDGNLYGIKHKDVEETFKTSGCIYVIMNPEGAEILKRLYGDKVVRLFVYADRQTVEKRQRDMGLPEDVIARHMAHYDEAMQYMKQCEHQFENYDIAHTAFAITEVLETYLQRQLKQTD